MLCEKYNKSSLLCHQYIDIVYKRVQEIFVEKYQTNIVTQTNGEILYPSVDKILHYLKVDEQDICYDLGSGFGKLALQVFLQTKIKEVIGIEIVPAFWERSMMVANMAEDELPQFYAGHRAMKFILGSFFEVTYNDATIILLNSVCYSQTMLSKIAATLSQLHKLRYVVSTRPLLNLKNLRLSQVVEIQCSWDAALCYIYTAQMLDKLMVKSS